MIESNSLPSPPDPWGPRVLADAETVAVRIGPRDLWLRAQDHEVWVAHARSPDPGDPNEVVRGTPPPEPPADVGWSRWAPPAEEREVALRPALPDRPLVLRPERDFTLLPGAEARIYVRVPLWIRVELRRPGSTAADAMPLLELPSTELSDTWWGGFFEGELCYWLSTTARREMRSDLTASHLAVCPLSMVNRSATDLAVQKLAFRVEHLGLFSSGLGIWTDTSIVSYQGDEEGSQIETTGRPPHEAGEAQRIADPRVPAGRGFRARTFMKLKELPGMGGIW